MVKHHGLSTASAKSGMLLPSPSKRQLIDYDCVAGDETTLPTLKKMVRHHQVTCFSTPVSGSFDLFFTEARCIPDGV
ncbi:MAG: hypothetical protein ABIK68_06985, partial [bacterium]